MGFLSGGECPPCSPPKVEMLPPLLPPVPGGSPPKSKIPNAPTRSPPKPQNFPRIPPGPGGSHQISLKIPFFWTFAPPRTGGEHIEIPKKVLPPGPPLSHHFGARLPPGGGGSFGGECSHPKDFGRVRNPPPNRASPPDRGGLNTPTLSSLPRP